ncbi:hypothetical protein TrVE_jg5026 [Triparma verrucosa]|uniref:NIF system FeS cluster assembly NifU C-terminal domain-containing protein n=1 Tax=Triparma verrucosa TaxID=1606542 RepID=A0A9W7BNW9_9STRA|nr:hypothetical protein TrVE_jg5026 [Triparma verrucosa]
MHPSSLPCVGLLLLLSPLLASAWITIPPTTIPRLVTTHSYARHTTRIYSEPNPSAGAGMTPSEVDAAFEAQTKMPPPPPPTLTEDRTLPVQILLRGLEASEAEVAAVYAVYSGADWGTCEFVGLTSHLAVSLRSHVCNSEIAGSCKNVRAVSFKYPQRIAMEEVKSRWEGLAAEASAPSVNADTSQWATSQADTSALDEAESEAEMRRKVELMQASGYLVSEDEDEDDDEDDDEGYGDDWNKAINAQAKETVAPEVPPPAAPAEIESPFEEQASPVPTSTKDLAFTAENVDKVLEEIRPYLISDGGNVAVSHIDEDARNVYLILQGACGSCPSSTTTMKMGIERVLKENFKDLGEVTQVDDPADAPKKELTEKAVHEAVNALKPAINAMGGVVEVIAVSDLGVAKLSFRGPNKIKYGLELAVLDVPMVKHVDFVGE